MEDNKIEEMKLFEVTVNREGLDIKFSDDVAMALLVEDKDNVQQMADKCIVPFVSNLLKILNGNVEKILTDKNIE